MPKPGKGENREKFLNRCMGYSDMQKYEQKQRYAICNSLWRDKSKKREFISVNIKPILLYPKYVEPQLLDYKCPNCNSDNRTSIANIVYDASKTPESYGFLCGWCGKDWFTSSKLILNNIIEDQINNLYNFTKKTGKEFGSLIFQTNRGILLDMIQMGEERSIDLKFTRKLEADEKLLGSFHCHPTTDTPSFWDIGTFLNSSWEKISCVAGANSTITVMVKTGATKKLDSMDIAGWREECVKRGYNLAKLSEKYNFETYSGKATELKSLVGKSNSIITLESLVRKNAHNQ